MSADFSPDKEKKLHSILDKGIEALRDSRENSVSKSPYEGSRLETSFRASSADYVFQETEKTKAINTELQSLQSKLADLEAKLYKKDFQPKKSPKLKASRPSSRKSNRTDNSFKRSFKKSFSSDKLSQDIKRSEKEIFKMERSISPSPSRKHSVNTSRQIDKIRSELEKERKQSSKLTKENQQLKKELSLREELRSKLIKLQEDYNELSLSFERSEAVRKKQKQLIEQLKAQLTNGEAPRPSSAKPKRKASKKGKLKKRPNMY